MIDYTGLSIKQFEILDDIMDKFDFDSVAQHMKDTNWMWADNTKSYKNYDDIKMYLPDVPAIRHELRRMIVDTFKRANETKDMCYVSCGGFTVYTWDDQCHVHFSIEEYFTD